MNKTVIELKGHLIDSLTLAKVIDLIHAHQASYRVDFIDVGHQKSDLSTAHISLESADAEQFSRLLSELKTYGAQPLQTGEASDIALCEADGQAPENALLLESCLNKVLVKGEWMDLNAGNNNTQTAIVIQGNETKLVPVPYLRKGDVVVVYNPSQAPLHSLIH